MHAGQNLIKIDSFVKKSVCCVALQNSSLRRNSHYVSFLISCAPCLRSFLQTRIILPSFATFYEFVRSCAGAYLVSFLLEDLYRRFIQPALLRKGLL